MSVDKLHEGDSVSQNLNGPHASDGPSEVKASDITVVSHRANDIAKTGTEADPTALNEKLGNDVAKTASELKVVQKEDGTWHTSNGTSGTGGTAEQKEEKAADNGVKSREEATVGEKRKADAEPAKATEKPAKETAAKKQKMANGAAPNGTTKVGPGRPKGSVAAKKEKKVPRIGTAQRKTRSQGSV